MQVKDLCFNAPAKINLRLKIVGRRTDRMHLLSMLNVNIGLYDQLKVRFTESPADREMQVISESGASLDLGPKSDNLVIRAANIFFSRAGISNLGIKVQLKKIIPVGAGLGGGSSDAVATLKAFYETFQPLEFRIDLAEIAQSLGSDLAYFLQGGLCRVSGVGEKVSKLESNPLSGLPFLLISPEIHISTVEVYKSYSELHPVVQPSSEVINSKLSYSEVYNLIENDLSPVVFNKAPICKQLLDLISDLQGVKACVTGSGSSMFCLPLKAGDIVALEAVMAKVEAFESDIPIKLRILEFL